MNNFEYPTLVDWRDLTPENDAILGRLIREHLMKKSRIYLALGLKWDLEIEKESGE